MKYRVGNLIQIVNYDGFDEYNGIILEVVRVRSETINGKVLEISAKQREHMPWLERDYMKGPLEFILYEHEIAPLNKEVFTDEEYKQIFI